VQISVWLGSAPASRHAPGRSLKTEPLSPLIELLFSNEQQPHIAPPVEWHVLIEAVDQTTVHEWVCQPRNAGRDPPSSTRFTSTLSLPAW